MIRVLVHPRTAILDGAVAEADAIISIRGAALPLADDEEADLDLACAQAVAGDLEAILRLQFDDIGVPRLSLHDEPEGDEPASWMDDVADLAREQGRGVLLGPTWLMSRLSSTSAGGWLWSGRTASSSCIARPAGAGRPPWR